MRCSQRVFGRAACVTIARVMAEPVPSTPQSAPEPAQPVALPTAPVASSSKFIRTFAGDMEVLKKGGRPDLAPFTESAPVPPPPPPAPAPVPQQPVPPPPATFVPEAVPIPVEKDTARPLDRLVAPSAITETPAVPVQTPVAPAAPASIGIDPALAPIHTYAEDFNDHLKETGASTTAVLAAEQDAPRAPVVAAPVQKGGWVYALAGVVLLLGGGGALYAGYAYYISHPSSVPAIVVPTAPIFVDDRDSVSSIGTELVRAVSLAAAAPLPSGKVRLISYTGSDTGAAYAALFPNAPDILLRNIDTDKSMVGAVGQGATANTCFILSVESYGDTFSGMLAWEPRMPRDLATLFAAYPVAVASSTQASSTPAVASTTPLGFMDKVVANRDARTYKDAQGKTVLIYGYFNQRTLVIARDESAFTELMTRLSSSTTVK